MDPSRAESDECELSYEVCTGTDLELVEDPYLADVHDQPGVMIRVCPACLAQRHTDV